MITLDQDNSITTNFDAMNKTRGPGALYRTQKYQQQSCSIYLYMKKTSEVNKNNITSSHMHASRSLLSISLFSPSSLKKTLFLRRGDLWPIFAKPWIRPLEDLAEKPSYMCGAMSSSSGCQSLRPFSTSAPSHFGLFPHRPFATSAHPRDTSACNADFFGPTTPSKVTIFDESQNDKHHFFFLLYIKIFQALIVLSFSFCKFLQILKLHWFCYTVVLCSMLCTFTCPFFDTLYSNLKLSAAGEQTIIIILIIPFHLGDFVYSAFLTQIQCHRLCRLVTIKMFLKPQLSFINGKYCLGTIVQAVVDIDHIDQIGW